MMTYSEILAAASTAALKATSKLVDDNPGVWYPCGFAWVSIKPARSKFVSFLKNQNTGHPSKDGYALWNPSKHSTQWMDAKYAGAQSFAKVLNENGIKAVAHCRMD